MEKHTEKKYLFKCGCLRMTITAVYDPRGYIVTYKEYESTGDLMGTKYNETHADKHTMIFDSRDKANDYFKELIHEREWERMI